MTNIEAAIGLAQLEKIDEHLRRRQEVCGFIQKKIRRAERIYRIPEGAEGCHHVQWMFSILLKDNVKGTRDELIAFLAKNNIETRPVFYPMHVMPPYYEDKTYPNAEYISKRGLNLPTHGLLTEEDIAYVCDKIREFIWLNKE